MKNLRPLIDKIIYEAQNVMCEMGDLMEAYEMPDYADKCDTLDRLWKAIDDYLKELNDDDEMEDLGLS